MKKWIMPVLASAVALAAVGEEARPFLDLDFDCLTNQTFRDSSPLALKARNAGGELTEGANGLALRLSGGPKCVNIDLPEKHRALEGLTISCWVAPEEAAHQEIVTAPAADIRFDGLPFMLRWRQNWTFVFETRMEDGDRRGIIAPAACVDRLSYPRRTWVHVAATCDGVTNTLYVNGVPLASTAFKSKQRLERIAGPVKIGGHGGCFKGAVDNLRLYDRALSAAEVKRLHDEKSGYRPAQVPKMHAGTVDGLPYASAWLQACWMRLPLKSGVMAVSSTGEIKLWGSAGARNPANQWDQSFPIAMAGQAEQAERFYTNATGNLELRADGSALFELRGENKSGLIVRQRVEITSADDVKCRMEMTGAPAAPAPVLLWPQYLYASAMRFVGHDVQSHLITGNLLDLDRDLRLRGLAELNLVISDNRLVVDLGPGMEWLIHGTRDPQAWRSGYSVQSSQLGLSDWQAWTGQTAVLNFTLKLEPDDQPCRLDRTKAQEITRSLPFDFSGLYARKPEKLDLYPADRDDPIYLDDEPVDLGFNIPEKTIPASTRRTKWFHIIGTYDGREGRLYLNGKLSSLRSFGIEDRPLLTDSNGTVVIGGPQEPFMGAIDNVRIYRRVL
ncbi:MAG: LamG domain-containing protein, partial [Kiritimatiellae bacterium]|nr:LamG domain-containing protein [Kiritimatiellia bacterium]